MVMTNISLLFELSESTNHRTTLLRVIGRQPQHTQHSTAP